MSPASTRDKILDAAQGFIARVGVNAMSYKHLSDVVGIRKASIHHHFPTKTDLLLHVVQRYHGHFMLKLDSIMADDGNGRARLESYCKVFEEVLTRGDCTGSCPLGMLVAEMQTLDPKVKVMLMQFYKENQHRLHQILEQGLQDGSLHFKGTREALGALIFSLLQGLLFLTRGGGSVQMFRTTVDQLLVMV